MKNKAKRIKNGHYMYRGFELKRRNGNLAIWEAFLTDKTIPVLETWSLERMKYQLDLFIKRISAT